MKSNRPILDKGMAEVLISIAEAARLLGVHPNTLKAWEVAGKLKAIRTPGGHRRYKLSEIETMQGTSQQEAK
jgi:excisionase family DNA binding protein